MKLLRLSCEHSVDMNRAFSLLLVILLSGLIGTSAADESLAIRPGQWRSFSKEGFPNLFAWSDTGNVYALRDGASALLIDLGDGSALEHLAEIGVSKVEWVLFTH